MFLLNISKSKSDFLFYVSSVLVVGPAMPRTSLVSREKIMSRERKQMRNINGIKFRDKILV